jgi:hypothetical protein
MIDAVTDERETEEAMHLDNHLFTVVRDSGKQSVCGKVSQFLDDCDPFFPYLGSWDPSRPRLQKFSQAACFR